MRVKRKIKMGPFLHMFSPLSGFLAFPFLLNTLYTKQTSLLLLIDAKRTEIKKLWSILLNVVKRWWWNSESFNVWRGGRGYVCVRPYLASMGKKRVKYQHTNASSILLLFRISSAHSLCFSSPSQSCASLLSSLSFLPFSLYLFFAFPFSCFQSACTISFAKNSKKEIS